MSITITYTYTYSCSRCDAVVEKVVDGVTYDRLRMGMQTIAAAAPDGWVAGVCYCPTCWAGISGARA